jgi:Zn finger protein HypA/HybF involved in hydrogenase expression
MFAYFYQVCILIFLLQGISIPFLLMISGVLWRKQSQQLESLKGELELTRRKNIKSDQIFESILNGLPKLRPLNCGNCGGSLLLQETETFCPYCHARGDLPEDYAAAVSLKSQIKSLLKSAVRHWRVANVLTYPPVGWIFFLLIFIEPLVLLPTVIIGSNVFPNTWIDKAFEALGETTSFLVMLSAFFGFIIWMIVFIFLTNLSKSLRMELPVVPVFASEIRGSETASCQACGGGIEYDAGDFACLCSYCNVENFRVRFVRREHAHAEKQKTQTKSVLFGAMEILEDFVGTFFFVSVILVGASILLTIYYAIKNLL